MELTVERSADAIRDELLATLEELERRRERVARVRRWLTSPGLNRRAGVAVLLLGGLAAGGAWWRMEPGRSRGRRLAARRPFGPRRELPPWVAPLLRYAAMMGARAWLHRALVPRSERPREG